MINKHKKLAIFLVFAIFVLTLINIPYIYFNAILPTFVNYQFPYKIRPSILNLDRTYKDISTDGTEIDWFYKSKYNFSIPEKKCHTVYLPTHDIIFMYKEKQFCNVIRKLICATDKESGYLYNLYYDKADKNILVIYEVSRETKEICRKY